MLLAAPVIPTDSDQCRADFTSDLNLLQIVKAYFANSASRWKSACGRNKFDQMYYPASLAFGRRAFRMLPPG